MTVIPNTNPDLVLMDVIVWDEGDADVYEHPVIAWVVSTHNGRYEPIGMSPCSTMPDWHVHNRRTGQVYTRDGYEYESVQELIDSMKRRAQAAAWERKEPRT